MFEIVLRKGVLLLRFVGKNFILWMFFWCVKRILVGVVMFGKKGVLDVISVLSNVFEFVGVIKNCVFVFNVLNMWLWFNNVFMFIMSLGNCFLIVDRVLNVVLLCFIIFMLYRLLFVIVFVRWSFLLIDLGWIIGSNGVFLSMEKVFFIMWFFLVNLVNFLLM